MTLTVLSNSLDILHNSFGHCVMCDATTPLFLPVFILVLFGSRVRFAFVTEYGKSVGGLNVTCSSSCVGSFSEFRSHFVSKQFPPNLSTPPVDPNIPVILTN